MTQVFSTGHTAAHCGVSKWPMHSVHFFGSITNVPPFSEIATLGHSGSQAEQLVHCDAMIFNDIDRSSRRRDQRALADFRVAALGVLDLAALDLVQIVLE